LRVDFMARPPGELSGPSDDYVDGCDGRADEGSALRDVRFDGGP